MTKVDSIDYNLLSQIFEKKGMDIIQNAMFSKLNELVENKKNAFDEDKEEDKKKMEEIFIKKGVGKPRGTLQEKQQQYFELVKSNNIKNPVQKTLDYYQICKDEKGEWIMNKFEK
jgi:hypothetical protein